MEDRARVEIEVTRSYPIEKTMQRRKRLTFWGANENDDSLPRAVIAERKTATANGRGLQALRRVQRRQL